ncbi:unnamed protein product, partial [Prorocentrum cordatum]
MDWCTNEAMNFTNLGILTLEHNKACAVRVLCGFPIDMCYLRHSLLKFGCDEFGLDIAAGPRFRDRRECSCCICEVRHGRALSQQLRVASSRRLAELAARACAGRFLCHSVPLPLPVGCPCALLWARRRG